MCKNKIMKKHGVSKKVVEEWAKAYLNSEEGKAETEKINQEFKNYVLFGKPTLCLNEEFLDDMGEFIQIEKLSIEDSLYMVFNLLN